MYHFYMGSVLLPIAPKSMKMQIKNQNKTMNLINNGEVNLLKDAGLTGIEFDVLIPAVQYPFAKYESGFKSASYFLEHFEKLKTEKKSFQFIVTRKMPDGKLLFDTNMTVSMEEYAIEESANSGFDLIVSVKLKQYKPFGTKIVKVIEETVTTQTPRPAEKESKYPFKYTVVKGDNLWSIARKLYGDENKWKVIYEANRDKIKKPSLIVTGWVLIIPDPGTPTTTKGNGGSGSSTQKTIETAKCKVSVTFAGVQSRYGKITVISKHNGLSVTNTYSNGFTIYADKGTEVTIRNTSTGGQVYTFSGSSDWFITDGWTAKINKDQFVTLKWTSTQNVPATPKYKLSINFKGDPSRYGKVSVKSTSNGRTVTSVLTNSATLEVDGGTTVTVKNASAAGYECGVTLGGGSWNGSFASGASAIMNENRYVTLQWRD